MLNLNKKIKYYVTDKVFRPEIDGLSCPQFDGNSVQKKGSLLY